MCFWHIFSEFSGQKNPQKTHKTLKTRLRKTRKTRGEFFGFIPRVGFSPDQPYFQIWGQTKDLDISLYMSERGIPRKSLKRVINFGENVPFDH